MDLHNTSNHVMEHLSRLILEVNPNVSVHVSRYQDVQVSPCSRETNRVHFIERQVFVVPLFSTANNHNFLHAYLSIIYHRYVYRLVSHILQLTTQMYLLHT